MPTCLGHSLPGAARAARRRRARQFLRRFRKVFVGDERGDLLAPSELKSASGVVTFPHVSLVSFGRLAFISSTPGNSTSSLYERAWYGGTGAKNQAEMDAIHETVLRRFAQEAETGVVLVHRGPSAEIGMQFEDAYFDWVYIDGDHLYEYVKRDLEVFATKLKPGGLLTGDDYGGQGWWDNGVSRAVDEFVAGSTCEPVRLRRQFVLRKV